MHPKSCLCVFFLQTSMFWIPFRALTKIYKISKKLLHKIFKILHFDQYILGHFPTAFKITWHRYKKLPQKHLAETALPIQRCNVKFGVFKASRTYLIRNKITLHTRQWLTSSSFFSLRICKVFRNSLRQQEMCPSCRYGSPEVLHKKEQIKHFTQ